MKNLEEILKTAKLAGMLKRIKRTGWVRIGVQGSESVADHVFRTGFLCMLLTQNLNINHKKLNDMIYIHDLGETATSDIRYEEGSKVLASEEAKNKIEEDILKEVFSNLENGKYYFDLWYEFRDQTSEEARLLKQIEKLEMALQATEYEEMGTKPHLLDEFLENAGKYIKDNELIDVLNLIKKQRK